jgi:ubiquinone/menaquinone biosynthesis C-methylase UbiE
MILSRYNVNSYFFLQIPGLSVKQYIYNGAENLSKVKSESVDVVVSTLVLCSVSDLKKVLHEIHRVLVRVRFMIRCMKNMKNLTQSPSDFCGSIPGW